MRALHLLLAIVVGAFWCSFALATVDAAAPAEGIDRAALVSALVVAGAALLRFVIVVVKPSTAKLGKWGWLVLLLLSVAAGFLEHLAGGGSLPEAIAVGVSLLTGGLGGGAAAHPVVKARAARVRNGSIGLDGRR